MIEGLIGKKIGMTHLFTAGARVVPVTVLEVGPCVVTQVRTETKDGYEAVQVGYGAAKQLNKPSAGHLAPSGQAVRHLREFKADDVSEYSIGQQLTVTQFQSGDYVDVISTTKGRGFQGVMRRHGFAGAQKTHGQADRDRAPGSIGAGTYPGRVVKGKKMPGHMGNARKTIRKLRVEMVDAERNLLMVRGPVPGSRHTTIMVRYAHGVPISERSVLDEQAVVDEPAIEAPEDQIVETVVASEDGEATAQQAETPTEAQSGGVEEPESALQSSPDDAIAEDTPENPEEEGS